jgi:iron complex outermembrane receptor protein
MAARQKILATWLLALAAGAAAATTARANANEADSTDYTVFDLGQLMDMDIVYGAASYDQKLTDAPAAVTVITADEIRAHGYRTLADVLASVRGFHLTYDRSYDYIGVRGFGRPGDYNTRVLILLDGHPANDIIYGTAAAGGELPVDLALVRRLEVIRGPGSALYGAGAFFAVINIVTWNGDELAGAEAVLEGGSFRTRGARASWGGKVGAGASLLLAAGAAATDGDDLYWAEFDDPTTNDGVFADGDREQVGHLFGKYRRGALQATVAWSRRDKRIPTAEWGMIFGDTGAAVSDERLALNLSTAGSLSTDVTWRARLGYDDYLCRGDYPFDDAGEAEPELRLLQHDEAHGHWWGGEVELSGRIGAHRLVTGGDFSRSPRAQQTSRIVEPAEVLLDMSHRVDHAGVYLQDEWKVLSRASLFLGLRYDSYSSFGDHLTPRCGLVARLAGRTSAKLLYGEAFRAPNAYELFYTDGISQKDNPGLEPERIRTWELVLERELAAELRVGVSLFDNAVSGLIDQTEDPDDGLVVFRNAGDARTWGAELDVDARLLRGLRGRLSLSLQRAENRADGHLLTNAPARLVKLNLTTPRQRVKLAGALEVQHVSRRRTLADAWAPAYAVANLDLTWWTPVAGLEADLAVDNLLDQRYGDPGASHQIQDVLAREGRLFLARLRWRP